MWGYEIKLDGGRGKCRAVLRIFVLDSKDHGKALVFLKREEGKEWSGVGGRGLTHLVFQDKHLSLGCRVVVMNAGRQERRWCQQPRWKLMPPFKIGLIIHKVVEMKRECFVYDAQYWHTVSTQTMLVAVRIHKNKYFWGLEVIRALERAIKCHTYLNVQAFPVLPQLQWLLKKWQVAERKKKDADIKFLCLTLRTWKQKRIHHWDGNWIYRWLYG